jgi:hypothetical protein
MLSLRGGLMNKTMKDTPMSKRMYMVIENFKNGDAVPVYRRFRDRGRMAPAGLVYVSSWVNESSIVVIN